jgi:hypothetical protein
MKYTHMLCWVRKKDQKEIKAVIKDIPLVFVHSKEELAAKIADDSYIVISLRFISYKFKKFVDQFPNNTFNLYRLKMMENQTTPQALMMGYHNIIKGQYEAEELRNNYLGIIKDLWQYRLHENPTVIYCGS